MFVKIYLRKSGIHIMYLGLEENYVEMNFGHEAIYSSILDYLKSAFAGFSIIW